jgi:predicted peptidase
MQTAKPVTCNSLLRIFMYKSPLITLLFLISICSFSQDTVHFTKGLMVNAPNRYTREAIYTDHLAFLLYTHALNTPVAGGTLGTSEHDQSTWQLITADSARRFRMRGGFGGGTTSYLYLTYNATKATTALLNIKGNSGLYVNGVPHMGDAYASGWLYIPVPLKKGLNELYVRGGLVSASLIFPQKQLFLNTEDATLPHIILNSEQHTAQGAVIVINGTNNWQKTLQVKTILAGKETKTELPAIPPMSSRKVIFQFNRESITQKGKVEANITLIKKGQPADEQKITLEAVAATDKHSNTFISGIDGSLQYYAVTPQMPSPQKNAALFLSVHGAGVEAIGQAKAYKHKDWGTLVAATNRRPRGFNWEDWGRLDALEVLNIAKTTYQPDPQRIYLTGHSMGGHGTWFLGATYPAMWAGIAPCSGYPTLKGYGSADGLIPDSSLSPMGKMLLRASNQSDVLKLVSNYKPLGIYVLHGDSDRVVSVKYARQMRKLLADFHTDMSYYEYPGGEHWFGDQSVDWNPLFDFFKWHTRLPDSMVNRIDFITANPGISAEYRWAAILQQQHPLQYSHLQLTRNITSKSITGTTENIRLLKLQLGQFGNQANVNIQLNQQPNIVYTTIANNDSIFLINENGLWKLTGAPALSEKGSHRYGTFKEAFNNRMVFVYGTGGGKEEKEWSFNKARYDAETWYYRGNGAVDIIPDKEFSLTQYANRGVVLYGNATTNKAWKLLLSDCPIQVNRNTITVGAKKYEGDDLGAYFIWPLRNSSIASVAVVTGTGIRGMQAANANQYFAGGSGFPDYMIFRLGMLQNGESGVEMTGFFDNKWKISEDDMMVHGEK